MFHAYPEINAGQNVDSYDRIVGSTELKEMDDWMHHRKAEMIKTLCAEGLYSHTEIILILTGKDDGNIPLTDERCRQIERGEKIKESVYPHLIAEALDSALEGNYGL